MYDLIVWQSGSHYLFLVWVSLASWAWSWSITTLSFGLVLTSLGLYHGLGLITLGYDLSLITHYKSLFIFQSSGSWLWFGPQYPNIWSGSGYFDSGPGFCSIILSLDFCLSHIALRFRSHSSGPWPWGLNTHYQVWCLYSVNFRWVSLPSHFP